MPRSLLFVFLFSLGLLPSSAEEGALPPRTVRLLAVGDLPPFRQEIRDGVRYELPPPEGSMPPSRIEISALNEDGEEVKSENPAGDPKKPGLKLPLNDISSSLSVPGAALTVRLQAEADTWHQVELPEGGDFLIILWRDPEEGNWAKARSRLVPDGALKFKAGDLRFINVAPVTIGIVIGDQERFELAPGKATLKSLGTSTGTPTEAHYQDRKRGWRRLWSSALVQNRGERSTVIVYRADGEKPRRPLKLIAMRERAVPLPNPARAAR